MYNSLGIILSDELIASELIKSLSIEYSGIDIKILAEFGNIHRIKNIFLSNCSFVGVEEILKTECLIILTDIGHIIDKIKSYNGNIIDFSGCLKNLCENVYDIYEPIRYITNQLFLDSSRVSGNIYLPAAVFGKAGVEELLNQMKNVYNFVNNRESYLGVNLPFNVIFLDHCASDVIKNYVAYMRKEIPLTFSLRLIPVMTGLIADFFYNYNEEPDLSCVELIDNCSDLIELINEKKIFGIHNAENFTITIIADYIDVIVSQILNILKDEVFIK
jgi:hypothetical protein